MRKFFKRRATRVVGVVVLGAVVVAILFILLNWYVAPTKPSDRKDLVLALAQILGGTALLSGLYFTWRTLQVNREGQITDRFTKAIEQLGSKEPEILLGGIYALERIARDSDRDHWAIMEVLTAYVRAHASLGSSTEAKQPTPDIQEIAKAEPPTPDIQAILTVLGRRIRNSEHDEIGRIVLRATDLQVANLQEANLSGVYLQEANLVYAFLLYTNLQGANLQRAKLHGANLQGANLSGVYLQEANLEYATGVTEAQIKWTIGSNETNLPAGRNPPEHWSKGIEEQKKIVRDHIGGG